MQLGANNKRILVVGRNRDYDDSNTGGRTGRCSQETLLDDLAHVDSTRVNRQIQPELKDKNQKNKNEINTKTKIFTGQMDCTDFKPSPRKNTYYSTSNLVCPLLYNQRDTQYNF